MCADTETGPTGINLPHLNSRGGCEQIAPVAASRSGLKLLHAVNTLYNKVSLKIDLPGNQATASPL